MAATNTPRVQYVATPLNMETEDPVQVTCPTCQATVVTNVSRKAGLLTWIAIIVLLIIFFPLAWAPCCIDTCKDAFHYCPACGSLIGVKKKI